jgi:hypothetical protein
MKAYNILEIDDQKEQLAEIQDSLDIDRVINKLILQSRAGNNLATNLYQKIKEYLNNITDIIAIDIPKLNNLFVYKM